MKAVINITNPKREEIAKIIEHFVAYDIYSFILFVSYPQYVITRKDLFYYTTNGIDITCVNDNSKESTSSKLKNIRGSLEDAFFLVYSENVSFLELDELILSHKENDSVATLGIYDKKMVACLLENEVFDYISGEMSFEKEILERIGQDEELNLFEKKKILI